MHCAPKPQNPEYLKILYYWYCYQSSIFFQSALLFVNNIHHLPLDGLFLEHQSVLVPDEVWGLRINFMPLHAVLEQVNDETIVWVLSETQISAVIHELLELLRLVFAEVFDGNLLFLLLDVGILLSLGSAWEALPWERSFQEVKEHMADSLEVISS